MKEGWKVDVRRCHQIVQDVAQSTPSFATTTTTACPNLDTFAKGVGDTGRRVGPLGTCPLVGGAGKVGGLGHGHL